MQRQILLAGDSPEPVRAEIHNDMRHDPGKYSARAHRKLGGVKSKAVGALVERYQPFDPLPAALAPVTPTPHPLWLLHELDRVHKHRRPAS